MRRLPLLPAPLHIFILAPFSFFLCFPRIFLCSLLLLIFLMFPIFQRMLSTNYNESTGLALNLFDNIISPVLLFGFPIWSLPQVNTAIKVQIFDIPEQKVKEWAISNLKELYPALEEDSVKSMKNIPLKNEFVVEFKDQVIKNYILSYLAKIPLMFNIINCWDKDCVFESVHTKFCKYVLGVSKIC